MALKGVRLNGVLERGRCSRLPGLDRRKAIVGASFVLHEGVRREAFSDGGSTAGVGREIGSDRFGESRGTHLENPVAVTMLEA
jgi:hypothetical protein